MRAGEADHLAPTARGEAATGPVGWLPRHGQRGPRVMKEHGIADQCWWDDLFEPEPEQWGLRGDPYAWMAMRDLVRDRPRPADVRGKQRQEWRRCHWLGGSR